MCVRNERGTDDRSVNPPTTLQRCRRKLILIPASYESFERLVKQWIAGCVMSRTLVAGDPIRRENELVSGNSTLLQTWETISSHRMQGQQVEILANYYWGSSRVIRIDFSTTPIDQQRSVSGSVHALHDEAYIQFIPSDVLPGTNFHPRPDPESVTPPGTSEGVRLLTTPVTSRGNPITIGRKFLIYTLKGYYRSIRASQDIPEYKGRVIGFADTLAQMAASLPPNAERINYDPFTNLPQRAIDPGLQDRLFNRSSIRGYLLGYDDAINYIRRLDNIRTVNQARRSVFLLRYLLQTYPRSNLGIRHGVREGLLQEYVPEVNWSARQFQNKTG